ncbi:uncharacterized protein [Anabrus simplex]|uniref:uncharacterized protein isoform X2 n=1 Tax=Anabrus simplex TaxID=316456 RepID=UPI0034DD0013
MTSGMTMEERDKNLKRKRTQPEFYRGSDYHNQIRDWSNREKAQLLQALRKYGYLNMKELCRAVPTKSKEKIKMFIGLWFKTARTSLSHGNINLVVRDAIKSQLLEGSNLNTNEKCPIDQWLEKLEAAQPVSGYNEIKCLPIAKSFLYISKFEEHPDPQDSGGIDFRALYEYLYCMLCGYPATSLTPPTARLLLDSLKDLASDIKEQGMAKEVEFLDKVQRVSYSQDGKVHQYPGKRFVSKSTDVPDKMESCLRGLLELRGFNPLNVPLELLKYPE